jgi:hypothetical protein
MLITEDNMEQYVESHTALHTRNFKIVVVDRAQSAMLCYSEELVPPELSSQMSPWAAQATTACRSSRTRRAYKHSSEAMPR